MQKVTHTPKTRISDDKKTDSTKLPAFFWGIQASNT